MTRRSLIKYKTSYGVKLPAGIIIHGTQTILLVLSFIWNLLVKKNRKPDLAQVINRQVINTKVEKGATGLWLNQTNSNPVNGERGKCLAFASVRNKGSTCWLWLVDVITLGYHELDPIHHQVASFLDKETGQNSLTFCCLFFGSF